MGKDNLTPRDKRYEVVEEYMEILYQLWDSWDDDAIVYDRENGVFADPSKVREIDFHGEFFKSKGRHFVAPSPQKRPVLWQAGSSDQGREFASKHAESVFGIFPTPKSMRAYADDIRTRADDHGRDPESVKLIYGLQTIIDRDKSRANDKYAEFVENVQIESALESFRAIPDSTSPRWGWTTTSSTPMCRGSGGCSTPSSRPRTVHR
jgi:alkanesulfonate monooxygenase SsuD/methylene tetrahydromethanopterin reductase-like flavin-dependent oxidoreductase (luciferase family)